MRNGAFLICKLLTCRLPVSIRMTQMWIQTRVQNCTSALTSLSRSRKLILLILIALLLAYYLLPSFFRVVSTRHGSGSEDDCLAEKLQQLFHQSSSSFDVLISHRPLQDGEKTFPIYVGNGKVAVAFDSQKGLFIRLNRALALPLNFYPVVQTQLEGATVKEAYALDLRSGIAYRIQTVKSGWRCASVVSKLYVHRSRPSVMVQDIELHNPTKMSLNVEMDQIGPSGWAGSQVQNMAVKSPTGDTLAYKITSGLVPTPDPESVVAAAIGMITINGDNIILHQDKAVKYHLTTVVHYTKPSAKHEASRFIADLINQVKIDMEAVMNVDDKHLRLEHAQVWKSLWQSGFVISTSKAENALNGDKINSTIYYMLSNVPAPLHNPHTTKTERINIEKVLYYPDRCYEGHSTLQADTLWTDVEDEDQISRVVTTWMITLEKQGCGYMVQSGAEGVLQAMVLSFGALRFHNSHLEMAIPPKDLHRDFYFRRINYGNNTHVNISVTVGEDNKANLFVALDRNDKPYYACDAGCLDAPVPLSKEWKRFPVKLTDPLTSILYITSDKLHVEELKHAIHVKAIDEAPAHEHHVIALHKHGHHFGGLPTLFWVSIAFLIIIFHLFLFKLIYNEYCQGQERYTRSKYNL